MIFLSGHIVFIDDIDMFFDYMNKVDPTKNIQSTMEITTDT